MLVWFQKAPTKADTAINLAHVATAGAHPDDSGTTIIKLAGRENDPILVEGSMTKIFNLLNSADQ
jgi:hypothetical protein